MKKFLLLFVSFFCLVNAIATQTIAIIDKSDPSRNEVIRDLLSIQKSLIVSLQEGIPEPFLQTGFLLVPMTPEYVTSLLEEKKGQIVCTYLDETLIGYIILTEASEFEELYRDPQAGRFETAIELAGLKDWLSDPAVGYIEQIGVRPGYSRMGIGSQLIEIGKSIKPHGLISDVFIYPVENRPSLSFFSDRGFSSPGVLYQYPTANANFPYEHRTQVFFWK